MQRIRILSVTGTIVSALTAASLAGCSAPEEPVAAAAGADGVVPAWSGVGPFAAPVGLLDRERARQTVAELAPGLGLAVDDLEVRALSRDDLELQHVRVAQHRFGVPVVGGEILLHLTEEGALYAQSGAVAAAEPPEPAISATQAVAAARASAAAADPGALASPDARLVYLAETDEPWLPLCYEVEVSGATDDAPFRDLVYVDAATGRVRAVHPTIYTALDRRVYTARNGTSLPGTLLRSEDGAASADADANTNYDHLYFAYYSFHRYFGRDSYDGDGARVDSAIHYGSQHNNAYWLNNRLVFGDGDGTMFGSLATAMDIVGHEFTHGVTQETAGLIYNGESGALNESMSDVFGGFAEAYEQGSITARTFDIGEDAFTPGQAGDALRYMADPARDGASTDYYRDRYIGTADGGGVHWNSGIANLAFYLLANGGVHPRGKSLVQVPAIGVMAWHIWYRALTTYMTSGTTFNGARAATAQAAQDLGGPFLADRVRLAWAAVGVLNQVPVRVFADSSYGGASQALVPGRYDVQQLTVGNDVISSLTVPVGWRVTLYSESQFWGDTVVAIGNMPAVPAFLNDRTSSILVEGPRAPILYRDPNFAGPTQVLQAGLYDVQQLTIGNDTVSSIAVPAGWRVTLYSESQFWGDQKTFVVDTDSVGSDLDNRTSSVLVERM